MSANIKVGDFVRPIKAPWLTLSLNKMYRIIRVDRYNLSFIIINNHGLELKLSLNRTLRHIPNTKLGKILFD